MGGVVVDCDELVNWLVLWKDEVDDGLDDEYDGE